MDMMVYCRAMARRTDQKDIWDMLAQNVARGRERTLDSGFFEPFEGVFYEGFVGDGEKSLWTGLIAIIAREWDEAGKE